MPFRSRLGVPAGIIFGLLAGGFSCALAAEPPSADQRAFVDIYRELIEINTTDSTGDTLRAACGDGLALELLELQRPGGRRQSVAAFLA